MCLLLWRCPLTRAVHARARLAVQRRATIIYFLIRPWIAFGQILFLPHHPKSFILNGRASLLNHFMSTNLMKKAPTRDSWCSYTPPNLSGRFYTHCSSLISIDFLIFICIWFLQYSTYFRILNWLQSQIWLSSSIFSTQLRKTLTLFPIKNDWKV